MRKFKQIDRYHITYILAIRKHKRNKGNRPVKLPVNFGNADTYKLSIVLSVNPEFFYIAKGRKSKLRKADFQSRKLAFDLKIDRIKFSIRLSKDKRKELYKAKYQSN